MRFLRLDDRDRRVIRLAIPALGTLAIEPLYILADTAVVGRLGAETLAGVAIAATVLLTIVALAAFLEYGVTPDVAHAVGTGDHDGAKVIANDALWMAVVLGAPVAAAVWWLARPLARALGGSGDVLDAASTYLSISALGLPFVFVTLVGHGVMRGHNSLRRPLIVVAVANVINIALEIVAVFVLDWGVAGSAWSTVVAQVFGAAAFRWILAEHRRSSRPAWERIRPMLTQATHLGVRSVAMLATWIAVTRVAASVDTPTLAANQVVMQMFTFLALVLDALAIPAQSLVAGALGRGDRREAIAVGWSSVKLSVWAGAALLIVLAATAPVAPWLFTNDGSVAARVTAGLLFLALMQIPGAIAFALDGALIGGHDARFLGRSAVFNLLALAPLLIATAVSPSLGIGGLWAAQLMWMISRALVNAWRFRSSRWGVGSGDDVDGASGDDDHLARGGAGQ